MSGRLEGFQFSWPYFIIGNLVWGEKSGHDSCSFGSKIKKSKKSDSKPPRMKIVPPKATIKSVGQENWKYAAKHLSVSVQENAHWSKNRWDGRKQSQKKTCSNFFPLSWTTWTTQTGGKRKSSETEWTTTLYIDEWWKRDEVPVPPSWERF